MTWAPSPTTQAPTIGHATRSLHQVTMTTGTRRTPWISERQQTRMTPAQAHGMVNRRPAAAIHAKR